MTDHCSDNAADRRVGGHWERQFCRLAAALGKMFTPHQIGRPQAASAYQRGPDGWSKFLLPDVTIWSAPGEHHEIKHKDRAKSDIRAGCYGLERYRLDALVRFATTTQQDTRYTIHDWRDAGAKSRDEPMPNDLTHWWTADIRVLARSWTTCEPGPSWVGGVKREVEMVYWRRSRYFTPLAAYWSRTATAQLSLLTNWDQGA